jgi:hypothetical protein
LRRPQPLAPCLDLVALPLEVADLGHDLLRIQLIFEIIISKRAIDSWISIGVMTSCP